MRAILMAGCLTLAAGSFAQDKATIVTRSGETIEGVFRGATGADVTIEVAGQPIRIELAKVRYVSFVGAINASAGDATKAPGHPRGSIEDALAALGDLMAATRVGLLRDQYGEKLVATMPRVDAYLDAAGKEVSDVPLLIRRARTVYAIPLSSVASWQSASEYMTRGASIVGYANHLIESDKGASSHKEDPAPLPLAWGPSAGRVGVGDLEVEKNLKPDHSWTYADVREFSVTQETEITITMGASPCDPQVYILSPAGGKVAEKHGEGSVTMKVKVKAGSYRLLLGCGGLGGGKYKLDVSKRPE